ncbi:MAG: hypothetical protein N2Z74_05610, partial [Syntrophales bacterium]|nr:hypothetical protein [Syntrophales bacterium]
MAEVVKRDEVKDILRHLHECKILLKKQNVYSCLLTFRDVLRRSLRTKMLPADMKFLLGEINIFQRELAEAKAYRDMFGPAAFRENDIKTTLDFIEMLISVKDEELKGAVENCHSDQIIDDSNAEEKTESMARQAKEALDQWLKLRPQYLKQASGRSWKYGKPEKDPRIFPFEITTAYALWDNA